MNEVDKLIMDIGFDESILHSEKKPLAGSAWVKLLVVMILKVVGPSLLKRYPTLKRWLAFVVEGKYPWLKFFFKKAKVERILEILSALRASLTYQSLDEIRVEIYALNLPLEVKIGVIEFIDYFRRNDRAVKKLSAYFPSDGLDIAVLDDGTLLKVSMSVHDLERISRSDSCITMPKTIFHVTS